MKAALVDAVKTVGLGVKVLYPWILYGVGMTALVHASPVAFLYAALVAALVVALYWTGQLERSTQADREKAEKYLADSQARLEAIRADADERARQTQLRMKEIGLTEDGWR